MDLSAIQDREDIDSDTFRIGQYLCKKPAPILPGGMGKNVATQTGEPAKAFYIKFKDNWYPDEEFDIFYRAFVNFKTADRHDSYPTLRGWIEEEDLLLTDEIGIYCAPLEKWISVSDFERREWNKQQTLMKINDSGHIWWSNRPEDELREEYPSLALRKDMIIHERWNSESIATAITIQATACDWNNGEELDFDLLITDVREIIERRDQEKRQSLQEFRDAVKAHENQKNAQAQV